MNSGQTTYYIGLMSGTSLDGIDVALVAFTGEPNCPQMQLVAEHFKPLPEPLKLALERLSFEQKIDAVELGKTQVACAKLFAEGVNELLECQDMLAEDIVAIGSHGLTIRHCPEHEFSLQITDPNWLAQLTGIDVIADFRNMDIAAGGQGAPLVPPFHKALLSQHFSQCAVLNLGGIANITVIQDPLLVGYDTGPANVLIDGWCRRHTGNHYDVNGDFARSGKVHEALLSQMLSDSYFAAPFPKSTGKEYFNMDWLDKQLAMVGAIAESDVQATLVELTAVSVANELNRFNVSTVFVAGGGVHNSLLMSRLAERLPNRDVMSLDSAGFNSDALEAMAFAWLAYCRVAGISANAPSVTGATHKVVLGGWYKANMNA